MNKTYLDSLQASPTTTIMQISEGLKGEHLEYLLHALQWLHTHISREIPDTVEKNHVFRKRTAEQIITDNYFSGCTDYALVFIALARARNIPTKYVEAIKKEWLKENADINKIEGHIFAECLIGDEWIQIDPQRGTVYAIQNYSSFEIYARGKDSWDLEIRSIEDLQRKFSAFRSEYVKNRN